MPPRKSKATKPVPEPKAAPKSRKIPDTSENAIEYTSIAARKRNQPTCSMSRAETEETIDENFIGLFGQSSDSHFTWGKTQNKAMPPAKRRRNHRPLIAAEMRGFPEPVVHNNPERSPFLRLPMEIREKIYGKFLKFSRTVILQHD